MKINLPNTVFFLMGFLLFSQDPKLDLPTFTVHSPDVAGLGLYNEYPVDISTGVPTIEVPLYTIRTARLELPISLSYHASGIRVDQESSTVGLGWVLKTGGVVTRILRDIADEEYYGYLNMADSIPDYNSIHNDFPAGEIGNSEELEAWKEKDKEPDEFVINSPVLDGRFCLDSTLQFSSMDFKPLKYNVDLHNDIMEITDKNGTLFRFGKSLDNDEAFESTSSIPSFFDENSGSQSTTRASYYTSSWHLTEMISSDRSDTIHITYKAHIYQNRKVVNVTRQTMYGGDTPQIDKVGKNFEGTTRNSLEIHIPNVRIIDRILFKNGSIEFSTATDRLDVDNGISEELRIPRITGLTVRDRNGDRIKKVSFDNNHYFNRTGNGSDLSKWTIIDKRKKSLKLKAVEFYDVDDQFVHDYRFQYDESVPLPPTNTTSQDFWGYYNGKRNSSIIPHTFYLISPSSGRPIFIGGNRESDIDYMKAGILNGVTYPTGGHTQYEYEPHYYLEEQQANGMTERTMTKKIYAINRSPSCDPGFMNGVPVNNTLDFVVSEELGSTGTTSGVTTGRLYVMFSDYKYTTGQSMIFKLTELESGTEYSFSHSPSEMGQIKVFDADVVLREGNTYRMEAKTNGVSGSDTSLCDSPLIEAGLSYTYWDPADTIEIVPIQAGGLRIRSISSFDHNGNPLTKKRYEYGNAEYGPNKVGVGRLITDPSKNFYYYPLLYAVDHEIMKLRWALFFSSNSQVELGMNNGSPIDYDKVTEIMVTPAGEGISNGKTEYYYGQTGGIVDKNRSNYKYPYLFIEYPDWKRSVLDSMIHYKKENEQSFLPNKKVEYGYRTFPEKRIKTLRLIDNEPDWYEAVKENPGSWRYYADNPNRFHYYNFYVSCGRKVKDRETVTEYGNHGETMRTVTEYVHGNPKHMEVTASMIINSSGERTFIEYYYPDDIGPSGSIDGPPIPQVGMAAIGRLKSDDLHRISEPVQTNTKVTDANGVLLSETTKRTTYRIWGNYFSVFPESVQFLKGPYSPSNPMEDRLSYHRYDESGNPLEVSVYDGPTISYLWSSKSIYPLAKIENARYDLIEGLPNFGTGFFLDGDSLTLAQENALRSHENMHNSQVTTYIFRPLVGPTVIRDPKGLGIHYHYDRFNRLKSIRDDDGNLISDYEYNYFKN